MLFISVPIHGILKNYKNNNKITITIVEALSIELSRTSEICKDKETQSALKSSSESVFEITIAVKSLEYAPKNILKMYLIIP